MSESFKSKYKEFFLKGFGKDSKMFAELEGDGDFGFLEAVLYLIF